MQRISKLFNSGTLLITTECHVSKGSEQCGIIGNPVKLLAFWDTGAEICGISPQKAKELKLIPLEPTSIICEEGRFKSKVYVVNIHFSPSWIEAVVAFEMNRNDIDFLIGMHLVKRGTFIIKPAGEGFWFSFEKCD